MSEAWKVTPDAGTQFDVALDWFAKRVPLTDAERKEMPVDARSRSFWIAGVAQLDVVETVMGELKKALAAGTPISDFQTAVRDLLARQWGKDEPARLETIFRNALQNAYNAGRYEQMTKPEMLRFRPYWLFDAILDGRTTVVCKVCGGTLLPSDDPWWDTHWPPLHHRCRSSVRALRASEAQRRGITETAPVEPGDTGFGLSPKLAKEWRPDAGSRDERLMRELEQKRADNDQIPQPPPLPKAFDKRPQMAAPKPELEESILVGGGRRVRLTPEQQRAQQTAKHLRGSFDARQQATTEERRTWMLWEWVRGAHRRTSALLKQAALREFGLKGTPWTKGREYTFQAADMTRAQRDLRALHDQTQSWFKRRGIRAVTLYRGVHDGDGDIQNCVEAWTSDKAAADAYSRKGVNGYVLKVTVPVSQVLAHYQVSEWLDGPLGGKSEYLVMW